MYRHAQTAPRPPCGRRAQRGVMSLLMALVILTLLTMVSLYTARTVTVEQRIAANVLGNQAAFEAAEAGMSQAMAYVGDIGAQALTSGPVMFNAVGNADQSGTNPVKTLNNGSRIRVNLDLERDSRGQEVRPPTRVTVIADGVSADGSAQRRIERVIRVYRESVVPNPPGVPLTARGTLDGSGSAGGNAAIRNPEGNTTIRSGGNFIFSGAANTFIANPNHKELGVFSGPPTRTFSKNNYPACLGGANACEDPLYAPDNLDGCANPAEHTNFVKCDTIQSSSRDVLGVDVDLFPGYAAVDGDEFFENIFGLSKTAYRTVFVDQEIDPANIGNDYDASLPGLESDHAAISSLARIEDLADDLAGQAHGKVLWVTGDTDITGNLILGCVSDPTGTPITTLSDRADIEPTGGTPRHENCSNHGNSPDKDTALSPIFPIVPVVLIIDGNLTLQGNVKIFGLVYVIGNFDARGNAEIQGALVVEGTGTDGDATYAMGSSGSFTLWYDSGILRQFVGEDLYTPIPGAWKDF